MQTFLFFPSPKKKKKNFFSCFITHLLRQFILCLFTNSQEIAKLGPIVQCVSRIAATPALPHHWGRANSSECNSSNYLTHPGHRLIQIKTVLRAACLSSSCCSSVTLRQPPQDSQKMPILEGIPLGGQTNFSTKNSGKKVVFFWRPVVVLELVG